MATITRTTYTVCLFIYLVFFPDNTVKAIPGNIARATIVCRQTALVSSLPILLITSDEATPLIVIFLYFNIINN